MTDPRLIPFKAEHLLRVQNRDGDMSNTVEDALAKERGGPAYTGIVEEGIVGCAGLVLPWSGVAMAWVALGPLAPQYGMWMTRTCRRVFQDVIRSLKIHRVEAVVLAGNDVNIRWAEWLGFTREDGVARKFTADQRDIVRYEYIP